MRRNLLALLLSLFWAGSTPALMFACPFCTSVSQTFSEEMNTMQVVVMAELVEPPAVPEGGVTDPDAPLPKAKFRIQQVLKGGEWAKTGQEVEVLFFGDAKADRKYLIMGTDAPSVMWTTPLGLSQRAYEYVLQLPNLPADAARLEFFQDYLEDEDEMLARDAYDEFAKTPYAGVKALKGKMHHDRLIAFIQNSDVPASRRRLYFTMLGVCGKPSDAALLSDMMQSDDRKQKAGLDALLACYLILNPEEGLAQVEERFLKNPDAEYADTYAAIMAIRFHGNDTDVIAKSKLVKALRNMLERPELADLVIPDLARWQDWESLPRMVRLFKEADEKSSWVRVPVINFLRSCPLPEAKEWIEQLAKIDPDAVKRAQTFFPFDATGTGGTTAQPQPDKSSFAPPLPKSEAAAPPVISPGVDGGSADSNSSADSSSADSSSADSSSADGSSTDGGNTGGSERDVAASQVARTLPVADRGRPHAAPAVVAQSGSALAETARSAAPWQPNTAILWGVPIVSGIALLYIFRLVLGMPLTGFDH